MAAHGMPADAALVGNREVRLDQRRQLVDYIVVHAVMLSPGLLGGVEIEAGAQAEIPSAIRVVRHIRAAWAGVRRDDDEAELRGQSKGAGLLHEILIGT